MLCETEKLTRVWDKDQTETFISCNQKNGLMMANEWAGYQMPRDTI